MTTEEIKNEDEAMYGFLAFLLIVPLTLIKSGAFYLLYKWFVLPMSGYVFTFWHVVGLALLAEMTISGFQKPDPDKPMRDVFRSGTSRILIYGLSILFGWMAKLMMG